MQDTFDITPQALAETHSAAFHHTRGWTAAEFETLLQSTGVILCGDARGFVIGRVISDEAEIITAATHPEFQRQGRAQNALGAFIHKAQKIGARTVFLEVASDNTAAKCLYKNNKFEISGTRPRYYKRHDGQQIDAQIMHLVLTNAI
jgi:ribosomal-protein-alanine N-acetyltransferase